MIICMSDKSIDISENVCPISEVVCVTNRLICNGDFFDRIEKIQLLAKKVLEICNQYDVPCILHSFVKTAREIGCKSIHLPIPVLLELSKEDRSYFTTLGASCHSVEDAIKAEELGCSYIIAGHIFDTDCKKGLPGRGLDFLRNICESVKIPVYAIGGITADNIADVYAAGAKGACVMSGLMK